MNKVSLVLSAYNGEMYIEEQLLSILNQTRQADEVIIVDDHSTDNTPKIISRFIKENGLVKWALHINNINMGWRDNFINAICMAKGDYIFLCDQDDIWLSTKINDMTDVLDGNADIKLLASNYLTFYEDNRKEIKMLDDGSVTKYNVDEQMLFVKRPGCVYAFRRELIDYYEKYGFPEYPHDAFIWRCAMLQDGLYIYNKMTIRYRRHSMTATGHEKKNRIEKIRLLAYQKKAVEKMKLFVENENVEKREKKLVYLNKISEWIDNRERILTKGSVINWLCNLKYMNYYYNYKSWIADGLMLKDAGNEKKNNRIC